MVVDGVAELLCLGGAHLLGGGGALLLLHRDALPLQRRAALLLHCSAAGRHQLCAAGPPRHQPALPRVLRAENGVKEILWNTIFGELSIKTKKLACKYGLSTSNCPQNVHQWVVWLAMQTSLTSHMKLFVDNRPNSRWRDHV